MQPKILYIISSYNLYGGTPKKTLDLMKHFKKQSVLYVYHDTFQELKPQFEATGGIVYEGFYGRNLFLHFKKLVSIIDNENINIVQTQFSMGETLGFLIKAFRPNVKLMVTFESSIKPARFKGYLVGLLYRKVDYFIYISKYVKNEKMKQFKFLKNKSGEIIYNGTEERIHDGTTTLKLQGQSILCIGSLIKIKNIQVLIQAIEILIKQKGFHDVNLYLAGEGSYKLRLQKIIKYNKLEDYVHFLGNQSNVGKLLSVTDIFVHPCYKEGFGIAVAEAMHAEKPIIVSNAGALPELIENEISGLIIDPHNADEWANAIVKFFENPTLAGRYAKQAKEKAEAQFSVGKYTNSYEKFYNNLSQS
jgi:glycosyltransferase involved in cell wall biosynthesis